MGEGEGRRASRVVRKTDLLSVAFGVRRPPVAGRRLPASYQPSAISHQPSAISRTLRRDGTVFEHRRCWHPIFSQWLACLARPALHFDPRNLTRLHVHYKAGYPKVPFSDRRMPAVGGSSTRRTVPPCHRRAACLRAADRGVYLAIKSSVARVSREHGQNVPGQAPRRPRPSGCLPLTSPPRRARCGVGTWPVCRPRPWGDGSTSSARW